MASVNRRSFACVALAAAAVVAGAIGCSSGSTEAYCEEATAVAADNPAAVFAAWDPANPVTTQRLTHAADQLHQLADVAPPEISDDTGLVASTADDLVELLTDLQGAELDAALRQRDDEFAEVDAASRRVTNYTRTECGVDFDAPPPTTTAPAEGEPTSTELP